MDEPTDGRMVAALHDFQRLRWRADLEHLLARLRGQSDDLLPFEEVRRRVNARMAGERQLREIPIAAIVGSVGRYHDFNRSFLPRRDDDWQRWSRVMVAADGACMAGRRSRSIRSVTPILSLMATIAYRLRAS